MRGKEEIRAEIEQTQMRLNAYLEQELLMLSPDGVQSYGIGSRNLSRYGASLSEIQTAVNALRRQLDALRAELAGRRPRKSVGAVPQDW